jgi:sugar lactone lactonase YvrE
MGEVIHTHMKNITAIILITAAAYSGVSFARTIPNHASATLVLGQSDFSSSQPGSSATELDSPAGVAMDPSTGKIFVADTSNHRVLRYANSTSLSSGASAEAVLGQDGFTNEPTTSPTSQTMSSPGALFVDHLGRLWVADRNNARVLRFSNASSIASQTAADRVYGQSDFTSNQYAVTASGMINPTGVWVDSGDRLWVSDEAACRVLRFDNITNKASGAEADGVLGQTNMTSGAQGSGAAGLDRPMAIAMSRSGSLFVACERGHRVLRFDNAASLANGAAAAAVFGQADFDGATAGLSATRMNNPTGLAVAKDDSLWVCDQNNHRMLRFNKATSRTNGAAADGVVGQADFVSSVYDFTAQNFYSPQGGMLVDPAGSLWVTDRSSNRVLRFPAVVSLPSVTVTNTIPKKTDNKNLTIKGLASDPNGIVRVTYQLGDGNVKQATGTGSWRITQKLKKGKNKISIFAEDPWGDVNRQKVITVTRK